MSLFSKVMKKNDVLTGTAVSYTEDGAGVVKTDGPVLFVPGLILGETAEIGITKMKKNYGYGRIIRITDPSPHRTEMKCSVCRLCGGCSLQHMDDEAQRRFKEEKVRGCFLQNAGMNPEIQPVLRTEPVWNYRNKVQIPVQVNGGRVEMGFYRNHSNTVIPYDNCEVQTELSNRISRWFAPALEKYSCGAVFRHILIKHAHRTGEVMVVPVVRDYPFRGSSGLFRELQDRFPEIVSLSVIINRREDNVILDGKEILISGRPYIEEELLGRRFRISARSFYQINPYATEILYRTAAEFAGLTGRETVIDLYCGTGTIGMICAENAGKVYGIEIVPEAVRDAKTNAEMNGINNIEFLNMDASKGAQAVIRSKIKADVVIVDPPRKGCSKDTIDAILKIAPKRLVYVSCDPATLARDAALLAAEYRIEKIQPVDMFPQTAHVETVCLLSKLSEAKNHISVKVDMNEMDVTAAESKATYQEIQEWVQEKHGFRVSYLNIAQVKRKHGILERENYNKPKSPDSKQPGCSEEKVKAIEEAMKYFQMI